MQNFSGLSGRQSCSIRHTPDLATNAWLPNALFRGNKDLSLKKDPRVINLAQPELRALWSTMCGLGCVKSGFERCLRRFLLLCVGGRPSGRPTQL